jgi:signal transduction histidine kinase
VNATGRHEPALSKAFTNILVRPTTVRQALLACLVVYNPVVCAAFTLTFGGSDNVVRHWLRSLAMADVVATQCLLGVVLINAIEGAIRRRRGKPAAQHGLAWSFLLSTSLMPLALPAGFFAAGLASRALGLHHDAPDFGSYRVAMGFGVIVAGAFFIQRGRVEAKDAVIAAKAELRELENKRLEAQLAALTAEMNPHLLFNALNTIASLIHQDPERAEETVVQLGALYRGVLRACGSATHPLADEVGLCEAYLRIEKARFGERLSVRIEIEPDVDTSIKVPVLLLQPFVENAVKHGVSQRARGGTVSVSLRLDEAKLRADVDDDGVGMGASKERGAGRGVANCRERLALTYGDRAAIDVGPRSGGGTRVTIHLPC